MTGKGIKELARTRWLSWMITLAALIFLTQSCSQGDDRGGQGGPDIALQNGKPYTRWWWFASEISREDVKNQLEWLKAKHFGGVEIAFIYPVNRDPGAARMPWLSPEWTDLVTFTKQYCDSIGMGCDFTFGTLWPFGGTFVPDSDRTKIYGDPGFKQPLRLSWTHPDTGNVIDHMDRGAFERYAAVMGKALRPALEGSVSALFCDSWEVETRGIWTGGFGEKFRDIYGYAIEPYMEDLYREENAGPRYDYMKLVADHVLNNFYTPFNEVCHELKAISRVQCAGSPTDILSAYAAVDIPETEAMLYNPNYSRIVASAAALGERPIVSAETFTCLYGWPANHIREEQVADLKLVADALFANGTNHIIWHGTPLNPVGIDTIYFYASVHVGEKGSLTRDLEPFNRYMEKVALQMRSGTPYSDIAVYIPQEDAWIAGEYPPEKQLPWAWGAYEMRYVEFPEELAGYQPLWINSRFLSGGKVTRGELQVGSLRFSALYVDVTHMDIEGLRAVSRLARQGLPVCIKKTPLQAGAAMDPGFKELLDELSGLENVGNELKALDIPPPLLQGEDLPEFWCRETGDGLLIFLSHPLAGDLSYPMTYGQSINDSVFTRDVTVRYEGTAVPLSLEFEPYQSILFNIGRDGTVTYHDIRYMPPEPVKGRP